MPIHLAQLAGPLVAKGGVKALKAATQLRREITAADAASVGPELSELTDATAELRSAISSQAARWRTGRERRRWEKLRTYALQPAMPFLLAQQLVAHLHEAGPTGETELGSQVGTISDDEVFRSAVQIARMDGRIVEVQGSGGTAVWAPVTTETHLEQSAVLRRMGYVDALVESICAEIELEGLLTKGELLKAVRRAEGDHRFNQDAFHAALEQALAEGKVTWLAPGVYGVAVEALRDVAFNGATEDEVAVGAALKRVVSASQSLRAALSQARGGAPGLLQAGPQHTLEADPIRTFDADFPASDLSGQSERPSNGNGYGGADKGTADGAHQEPFGQATDELESSWAQSWSERRS